MCSTVQKAKIHAMHFKKLIENKIKLIENKTARIIEPSNKPMGGGG